MFVSNQIEKVGSYEKILILNVQIEVKDIPKNRETMRIC